MAKKTSKRRVHKAERSARKPVRRSASKKKAVGKPRASAGLSAKARAIGAIKWTHQIMDALIADVPENMLTFQPAGCDNHVLWTLGHLATVYTWFAGLIDGQGSKLPDNYQQLFGYKSIPVADRGAYPSLADVRGQQQAAYDRLISAIENLKDADLAQPTATDSHGLAADKLDVVYRVIWHDGWHQGQISTIRRALGLKSIM